MITSLSKKRKKGKGKEEKRERKRKGGKRKEIGKKKKKMFFSSHRKISKTFLGKKSYFSLGGKNIIYFRDVNVFKIWSKIYGEKIIFFPQIYIFGFLRINWPQDFSAR